MPGITPLLLVCFFVASNAKRLSRDRQAKLSTSVQIDSRSGLGCSNAIRGGQIPVVALLSGTAEGKSTTICALTGEPNISSVGDGLQIDSHTDETCVYQSSWFYPYDGSDSVDFIDTPGFQGYDRGKDIQAMQNIVNTFKAVGQLHAILLVFDADNPKFGPGRQEAFKFVRAYFGKPMYKHLIFVYTHFKWKQDRGFGLSYEQGAKRNRILTEVHQNVIRGVITHVESRFWPDGKVGDAVVKEMDSIPFYGHNIYPEQGVFEDSDMAAEDYNMSYPDRESGIYNEEREYEPNSASVLRAVKEQILKIARLSPLNLTKLRSLHESCENVMKATLKDNEDNVQEVGQNLIDCARGQMYKKVREDVKPFVKSVLSDAFAAFAVRKAAAVSDDHVSIELANEIRQMLELSPDALDAATNFRTFQAYHTCNTLTPHNKEPSVTASALSICLQGIEDDKHPWQVEQLRARFLDRRIVTAERAQDIYDAVQELPMAQQEVILEGPLKVKFESFFVKQSNIVGEVECKEQQKEAIQQLIKICKRDEENPNVDCKRTSEEFVMEGIGCNRRCTWQKPMFTPTVNEVSGGILWSGYSDTKYDKKHRNSKTSLEEFAHYRRLAMDTFTDFGRWINLPTVAVFSKCGKPKMWDLASFLFIEMMADRKLPQILILINKELRGDSSLQQSVLYRVELAALGKSMMAHPFWNPSITVIDSKGTCDRTKRMIRFQIEQFCDRNITLECANCVDQNLSSCV